MNPDKFFDKMKKKPEVQEILDNIDNYSIDDISNLSGSHFPQWVRDSLLRKKQGTTRRDPYEMADAMNAAAGYVPMVEIEDLPMFDDTPPGGERRTTSADFAPSKERTGAIFDSMTQGQHEVAPGFEEHMKKVRERMRNK